jgi:hypothetical protein
MAPFDNVTHAVPLWGIYMRQMHVGPFISGIIPCYCQSNRGTILDRALRLRPQDYMLARMSP